MLGRSLIEEGQETASQPRRLGCACSLPPGVLLIRAGVSRRSCVSFFFSSRRRHTRLQGDWSSDVCSSDLSTIAVTLAAQGNENAVGFSLSFDPALASYNGASAGSAATEATLYVNTNQLDRKSVV